ncbi:MAG: extracellular solute-binding protein [Planctomycetaceae bacterium]|nr:extracellular solute-binding protein [Planctomycetaceae bacterium]
MFLKRQLSHYSFWGTLICSIALLSLPLGCDSDDDEDRQVIEEVITFSDEVVTILYPQEIEGALSWKPPLDEWKAQTLGQVELVVYSDLDELLEKQVADPASNMILFYPRTEFAKIGSKKLFQPIPEILQGPDDLDLRDLFDALGNSVIEWNGEPAVIPIREPMLLLYYRSDLLEAAGKEPPASWDEYRELLKSLSNWAPGLTAVEPWGPDYRPVSYLTHTLPYAKTRGNYSVFFDYRSGEPLVDSPGFAEGIAQCRELLPLLAPESLQMSPDDCIDEIRQGRAAMAIGSAFDSVSDSGGTPKPDDYPVSVVPIPGAAKVFDSGRDSWRDLEGEVNRVMVTGWDGLSVSILKGVRGEENTAAWNLLRSLLIDYSANSFVPGYRTSTRLSTSTQIWSPRFPHLNERSHVEAVSESLKESEVVPALMIDHRDEFLKELSTMIDQAIIEKAVSPHEALATLATRWSELMEKYGREETLSSYASGLGVTIRNLKPASSR